VLSHHQSDPATLAKLKEIGRWEMEQFARLVTRLDAVVEANGKTVLDNTVIYLSSEIADGNTHNHYDNPTLLVGGAAGKLRIDGSHHMYTNMPFPRPLVGPRGGPHTIKAFVAILNAFGIADDTFGDGSASGPLPELVV
jgi:hypothetical protein